MNYSDQELRQTFGGVGENVRVDKTCALFGAERIRIASNVRIDAYSVLSAGQKGIIIGDHVHIAAFCGLFGNGGAIVMEPFCGLSVRATLLTGTDDFVTGYLTNPTVPARYRRVKGGDVLMRKHALVGSGAIVLSATLGVAAAVGALSFVTKDVGDFEVVRGCPAKKVAMRQRRILDLEQQYLHELTSSPPGLP